MKRSAFDAWVTCPIPKPHAQLRMFCFPYAGGGASLFRPWTEDVPSEIEICPIQLPGRESRFREPMYTSFPPLVQELSKALSPYLDIPFAFFGHSMGALLSFELARALRAQAKPAPIHLFVSAHRAPQVSSTHPLIHHLSDPLFIDEFRKLNGTPKEVVANDELMQVLLPYLRADFTLVETYEYIAEEPLPCPISAFGGLQDETIRQDKLAPWQMQTTKAFSLRMFPGDHFFLHSNRAMIQRAILQDIMPFLQQLAKEKAQAFPA